MAVVFRGQGASVTAVTFWSFSERKKATRVDGRVLCHRGAARNPNDTITIGALIHARRAGQTCLLPSVRTPLPLR